jgi:Spy/CpxP family protein refolding chaperone
MRALAAFLFVGAVLAVTSYGTAQPPGGEKKGDKGGFPGKGGDKGGFPGMKGGPAPGQVLPPFLVEQLKLTDDQKKQLDAIQKDVDAKLDKLLTDDQKKQLKEMKDRGPGRGPGEKGGPPGDKGGKGDKGPPQE